MNVSVNHDLNHHRGGKTWKIRTPGGHGKRKAKAKQIMSGIPNHRLIEITDLDFNPSVQIRNGAKVCQCGSLHKSRWGGPEGMDFGAASDFKYS